MAGFTTAIARRDLLRRGSVRGLIAADLAEVGIDVDCMPVADLPVAGADAVIGDRAFGAQPDEVAALAGAFAHGLADGGVLPVLKHIPGPWPRHRRQPPKAAGGHAPKGRHWKLRILQPFAPLRGCRSP